jgi:hypothetical protein
MVQRARESGASFALINIPPLNFNCNFNGPPCETVLSITCTEGDVLMARVVNCEPLVHPAGSRAGCTTSGRSHLESHGLAAVRAQVFGAGDAVVQ